MCANAVNEMDGQGDGCMYRDGSRCATMRLFYLLLQHALGEMNESHYVNASSLFGYRFQMLRGVIMVTGSIAAIIM